MENNELKAGLEAMMAGLNTVLKATKETVEQNYAKMGPDEARKFKEEYEKHNVEAHIENLKKTIPELNMNFKFDF